MSLRGRLTLMSAAIVGAILVLAAVICFLVMRGELRGQIDDSLRAQAALIRHAPARRLTDANLPNRLPGPPKRAGGTAPFAQFIEASGAIRTIPADEVRLPVDDRDRAVARGSTTTVLRDRQADGVHVRMITVPVTGGGALQLARSLESTDRALSRLRILLGVLALGGVALAAALSRLFSRRVIAPIADLTAATEHIEATGDLGRRVLTTRADEVGRLAGRFNGMLDRLQATQGALEASTAAQRQLVADASHELRTPVASLRTNIEVLLAGDRIDPDERRALLADVVGQTEELTAVVTDLIDLARGDRPPEDLEDLDLAAIADEAIRRAALHAPTIRFDARLEPFALMGSTVRLARAVNNLLDNAAKFSPPGSTVDVTLRDGRLRVRDHGPGVAEDERSHIFDRFYRGASAAGAAGSGLGLAIVKQVADAHGASLTAANAPGGGLAIELAFADAR
ncbi:MAG: sensor histidine kinase [Solirubrobacterales bacterium]|nr:sensor histidine kinase [Solirubrobacterales bacterium]